MNIIGQDKLINKINSTNIDDWPSSTILLGDVGCGKHTVLNYITNRYNLKQIELTKNLNQESIEAAYQRVEPCLYYFDAKLLSEKQQNMLLKFIEEPLSGSFIVILCDNRSRLLPTVLNRCQVLEFEAYNTETLSKFIDADYPHSDYVLELSTTPGQVKLFQSSNANAMKELADKMFDKMSTASFSNTLSISSKIAFKGEKDKFDAQLFIKVLNNSLLRKIQISDNPLYYEMFNIVQELVYKSKLINVDMRYLFDSFLCKLWRCSRNDRY